MIYLTWGPRREDHRPPTKRLIHAVQITHMIPVNILYMLHVIHVTCVSHVMLTCHTCVLYVKVMSYYIVVKCITNPVARRF